jgi:hypothetical protein
LRPDDDSCDVDPEIVEVRPDLSDSPRQHPVDCDIAGAESAAPVQWEGNHSPAAAEPKANDMDVVSQYRRFRMLVADVVEQRKTLFPDTVGNDWVVRCFETREEFEARFPDRSACELMLKTWEDRAEETRREVNATVGRIRREGLSEQDEAILHHDLPAPE